MASDFPTSLDDFANPTADSDLANPSHSGQHAQLNDAVEALEEKLGTGASVPTTVGHVLTVTGAGATEYAESGVGTHDHDADYEPAGAVATHSADTTSVHGITDTTVLATDAEVAAAISAHEAGHAPDGTYVEALNGGKETLNTVAASGSTETLDLADGNVHDVTLTADCTFTFAGATNGYGCSFTLILRQDGTGGWDPTWPGSVVWREDTPPTMPQAASDVMTLSFMSIDGGTTWFGDYSPVVDPPAGEANVGNIWQMVKNNTSQTLTNNTADKITFEAAGVDGGDSVIDLANDQFVAADTGLYLAIMNWRWTGSASPTASGLIEVRVNGSATTYRILLPATPAATTAAGLTGSLPLSLSAADAVTMYINPGAVSSVVAAGSASVQLQTSFTLVRIA
jgi:hypothetical protein